MAAADLGASGPIAVTCCSPVSAGRGQSGLVVPTDRRSPGPPTPPTRDPARGIERVADAVDGPDRSLVPRLDPEVAAEPGDPDAEERRVAAVRELPAPQNHAERAWDFFTGTDALTRDVSVNLKGLAQVIATLKETGLLRRDASDDPKTYIDDTYLKAARSLSASSG